jgi:STE24 endopeptidase
MNAFSWIFLAALAAATLTRWWLAHRQIAHVRAHRDTVPAMFADSVPLEAHRKAADYTVAKSRVGMLAGAYHLVVVLALTLGGGLQVLSDLAARAFPAATLLHGTLLLIGLFVLQLLLNLPFALYRTFVIEQKFGFNRMTWRLYLKDLAKQLALAAALGVPLILAILWLMERMGAFWWVYVWLLITAYSVFLNFIIPTLILPWFNKFTPLTEGELAERVRDVLRRCGFRSRGVYVMDGSKRSSHGNAFFAGFGASKRIVLFDTLVDRLDADEVEAVLAHELGHYRLRHVLKGLVLGAVVSLAGLWILGLLLDQSWFYSGLGIATPSLAAALALFLLTVPEFTFFFDPLFSRLSRKHEFEADAYATGHAEAAKLAAALVKLYRDNASTLTPDPLHSAFYDSHPPAAARISRLRPT